MPKAMKLLALTACAGVAMASGFVFAPVCRSSGVVSLGREQLIAALFVFWLAFSWVLTRMCRCRSIVAAAFLAVIPCVLLFMSVFVPYAGHLTRLSLAQNAKLFFGILYVSFIYASAAIFIVCWRAALKREAQMLRKTGIVLFCLVTVFYAAIGAWTTRAIHPTGDEPLYLLAASSLIEDNDLDMSNNYAEGDWKSFMPEGTQLSLWESRRSDGGIYLDERVLFIAFLAGPLILAGPFGVSLALILVSALFVYGIYRLLLLSGFSVLRSLSVGLLAAFTQPMVTMSSRIYHNALGALCVLACYVLLLYGKRSRVHTLAVILIVLAIPWIHISYAVFSLTLFGFFCFRYRSSRTLVLTALSLGCIDALFFCAYRVRIHEGFSDFAGAVNYALTPHVYRSLLALFFDQEAGLFFLSPVYILSVAGFSAFLFLDKASRVIVPFLCVYSGYILLQGSLPAFGGGYDTGRSLIQMLPFISLFCARALFLRPARWSAGILVTVSMFIGYCFTAVPWLAVNVERGINPFMRAAQRMSLPVSANWFPSFLDRGREQYGAVFVFLIVVCVWGIFAARKEQRESVDKVL